MSKKKNNISKSNPTYEVVKKIRGDWNGVNPVTKIIPNKKIKHKGRQYED